MITIIIPVFNNLELTRNCVDSIYKYTGINDFKLIIVNNASTDGTFDYLKKLKQEKNNFSFINNEINLGFSKANNQAAAKADTGKLLFLNNDTEVTPGWLEALDKGLDEPGVKIAGAKLLYADNTVQHSGITFSKFKNGQGWPIIYHIFRDFSSDHPAVNRKKFMRAVTGACLLMDRDFYLEIGGFDEQYVNGFEDVDLCLKTIEKGGKIIYCPESTVYHYEGKTPGRHNKTGENTELFYSRWKDKIIPDDYLYYEQEGFILHKVEQRWKTVNKTEDYEIKEEYLSIIFERKCVNPVTQIFLTEANPEKLLNSIMEIQKTFIEDFEIIAVGNADSAVTVKNFTDITLIHQKNFNLSVFEELLLKSKAEKIIFWKSPGTIFQKSTLLKDIENFKNNSFEDFPGFMSLASGIFVYDPDCFICSAKYFLEKNQPKKALEIINDYLKKFGSNRDVMLLLVRTLELLGDYTTAARIKENL